MHRSVNLCFCLYICISIYLFIYLSFFFVYRNIHVQMYRYIYLDIHLHKYISTCTLIHTHKHTHTHTHTHARAHTLYPSIHPSIHPASIQRYITPNDYCASFVLFAARIDQVPGSTREYRFAPEGLERARGCALEPSATSRRSPEQTCVRVPGEYRVSTR